jgi:hypothetical protein
MGSVFKAIAEAERDGFTFSTAFRKLPTQATTANVWFDLSMSPGNPVPNYYIGSSGVFTPLAQSTDGGILHGGNVGPKQKHISLFEMQTAGAGAPLTAYVLDYLGFYPFLDESVTDPQPLSTNIAVPRYGADLGIQMLPVVVAGHAGGQTFRVTYTNDRGVAGRVTPEHIMGTQSVNGTIISSGGSVTNSRGPFMALQEGDTGVKLPESIQFLGTGDIGLIALALVKPIMRHSVRGIDAPVEVTPVIEQSHMPIVKDDAYLNAIILPSGSVQGTSLLGYIKTTWI